MRELKFRAIISENTTIYFTLEDLVTGNPLFSIRELLIPWLREGNIPDRYAGLKDKSNTEIYEGDIIKWQGNSASYERNKIFCMDQVIFCRGEFTTKSEMALLWSKGNSCSKEGQLGDVEIIGNIYENSELKQ